MNEEITTELALKQIDRFARAIAISMPEYTPRGDLHLWFVRDAKQIVEVGAERWMKEHKKEIENA